MITQKVYKFGTGEEIPDGAKYLCTKTETITLIEGSLNVPSLANGGSSGLPTQTRTKKNILVWHYFLVEVRK
jgi:hypothetical protein